MPTYPLHYPKMAHPLLSFSHKENLKKKSDETLKKQVVYVTQNFHILSQKVRKESIAYHLRMLGKKSKKWLPQSKLSRVTERKE